MTLANRFTRKQLVMLNDRMSRQATFRLFSILWAMTPWSVISRED
jgi:hypothetical protein